MYYIKVSYVSTIPWCKGDIQESLILNRDNPNPLCTPKNFSTYEEALEHCKHINESVVFYISPTVNQWLLNNPEFKMVDKVIQCITDYAELQASLGQWRLRNSEEYNTKQRT